MQPPQHQTPAWFYVQIYLHQDWPTRLDSKTLRDIGDQLLRGVIQDCVAYYEQQGWFKRFFFIRYGEGGYHMRLRFAGHPDILSGPLKSHLEAQLTSFFRDHPILLLPEERPGSPEALWRGTWLRQERYEPEYTKYGGAIGLQLAEAHFDYSSRTALRILEMEQRTNVARSHMALDLLDLLLQAGGYTDQETICLLKSYTFYWLGISNPAQHTAILQSMERNYQRRKPGLLRRLDAGRSGEVEDAWSNQDRELFEVWHTHVQSHVAQLKSVEQRGMLIAPRPLEVLQGALPHRALPTLTATPVTSLLILPNYLHLLNNRIGISPLQEIQLTHLLYRALEEYTGLETSIYPLTLEPDAATIPRDTHGYIEQEGVSV